MNPFTTSHKKVLLEYFKLKLGEEYRTGIAIPNLYEIKNNNIFEVLKLTRS